MIVSQLRSRDDALEARLKRFFTGVPCKHGHVAERYVRNWLCAECARLAKRARYYLNPQAQRDASDRWIQKNSEKVRIQNLRHRARHLDKVKGRIKRWKDANPENIRTSGVHRRARKRGALGKFTAADIARIFKLQKGRCAYCREKLGKKFERDHIKPLAQGGTNEAKNIQLLCVNGCNQSKHAKDPIDYSRQIGRLI